MSIYTNSQTVNMVPIWKSESSMNLEMGTKVFSVINCIFTGLMSMTTFVLTMVYVIMPQKQYTLFIALVLMGLTACFVAGCGFGIVLAIGVFRKKPKFVKTYFIFGVLIDMLAFILAIAVLVYWSLYYEADYITHFSIGVIIFCVIFSAVLYMIWKTLRKFEEDIQYKHRMLPEARY